MSCRKKHPSKWFPVLDDATDTPTLHCTKCNKVHECTDAEILCYVLGTAHSQTKVANQLVRALGLEKVSVDVTRTVTRR